MCLSPVTILNPTKYVSVHYRDRFLLQVPCGKCADCQSNNSKAWLFRSYYEFLDCFRAGGFVYFDTLTYRESTLPHLDELFDCLPHYPCFRPKDITNFMKRLRINLKRSGYDINLRYFISTEYGTLRHRPHMHLLFFVVGDIDPLVLSQFVATSWNLGLTDGVPFRSSSYVMQHNIIKKCTIGEILSAANYVTKYVQKNCEYQRVLDMRIKKSMDILSSGDFPFAPSNSVKYAKVREAIVRCVNQFHRQSLHFGESALTDFDLNQIFRDGYLVMPSNRCVVEPLAIPTYYKRKLFYEQFEINGCKMWQLTPLGRQYKDARKDKLLSDLVSRFECAIQERYSFDCKKLADYVLNVRGRYAAQNPESSLIERCSKLTHYPYLTRTDKENVGIGISMCYIGNVKQGYLPLTNYLKPFAFIANYVMMDDNLESQLTTIYALMKVIDDGKQKAYELKQRLTDLYKTFTG